MSDTSPTPTARSNGTRYLFLFLIGLMVGVTATVMGLRALNARKDHFPEALMHVQQWHMAQLKKKVDENRCAATDVLPHLKSLRTTADDLEAAFADIADDQRFRDHASQMRSTLNASLASPPLNCASVGTTAAKIGESCKACHQDFRG